MNILRQYMRLHSMPSFRTYSYTTTLITYGSTGTRPKAEKQDNNLLLAYIRLQEKKQREKENAKRPTLFA